MEIEVDLTTQVTKVTKKIYYITLLRALGAFHGEIHLARMSHALPAATTNMAVLPGVLGFRLLGRTVQVRLGTDTLWLPGGTPIFTVSRLQCMRHPGYKLHICSSGQHLLYDAENHYIQENICPMVTFNFTVPYLFSF